MGIYLRESLAYGVNTLIRASTLFAVRDDPKPHFAFAAFRLFNTASLGVFKVGQVQDRRMDLVMLRLLLEIWPLLDCRRPPGHRSMIRVALRP